MKNPTINEITFGVEIECILPSSHPFRVGGYHNGIEMDSSYTINGETIQAPSFNGKRAKCEHDSSLRTRGYGRVGVEIVTPILKGEEGRQFIIDLFAFIKQIGGKVNRSCGQHIHLGLESITGRTATPSEVTLFLASLVKISSNLQYGAYAQTGTDRNRNNYSREIMENSSLLTTMTRKIEQRTKKHGIDGHYTSHDVDDFARTCTRGSFVNLTTIRRKATIEFRWGAGTLNIQKFLSHLFTCEYIARRAWRSKAYPKQTTKHRQNHIHRGDNATRGQRALNYLVNDFRKNQDGRAMFHYSEIFKNNFSKMWSTSMRMARKWDKLMSGVETSYSYGKDPKQAMLDKISRSTFTWFERNGMR
jgi:hypothetical protein